VQSSFNAAQATAAGALEERTQWHARHDAVVAELQAQLDDLRGFQDERALFNKKMAQLQCDSLQDRTAYDRRLRSDT
jgi:hypothetical protein